MIFDILCVLLYLIGLPFGWTYQQTSVNICIYLWPALCEISYFAVGLAIILRILFGKHRLLALFLLPYYAYIWYLKYALIIPGIHYHYRNATTAFDMCVQDLLQVAAACNTSYAAVNLIVYVLMFVVIVGFNLTVAYLIQPFNLRKQSGNLIRLLINSRTGGRK